MAGSEFGNTLHAEFATGDAGCMDIIVVNFKNLSVPTKNSTSTRVAENKTNFSYTNAICRTPSSLLASRKLHRALVPGRCGHHQLVVLCRM